MEPSPVELRDIVRHARDTAELTQRQLAELAATSQAAVTKYERQQKSPTLATVERLLAAAGFRALVTLVPYYADVDAAVADSLAKSPKERMWEFAIAFASILDSLRRERVELVVAGDLVAVLHGLPLRPVAGDLLVLATSDNLDRLERAAGWAIRMHVPGGDERFPVRRETLQRWGDDVTLLTAYGDLALRQLDADAFRDVRRSAVSIRLGRFSVPTADLAAALAQVVDQTLVERFLVASRNRTIG